MKKLLQIIISIVLIFNLYSPIFLLKSKAYDFLEPPIKVASIKGNDRDGIFNGPAGIRIGTDGNLYSLDIANNRVQIFDTSGNLIRIFGTPGTGDGEFNSPSYIALDSSNNIYVSDTTNQRVQKFTSTGTFLLKFGTNGNGDGGFQGPSGIAIDSTNRIWVVDSGNFRVQVFDSSGNFQFKFGSTGSGNGQFNYPRGLFIDSNDKVYVADDGNHRIQIFDSSGNFLNKFGTFGTGDGQLKNPKDVAVNNGNGDIYVIDSFNGRYQVFNSSYTYQSQVFIGNALSTYVSIARDSSGNIYVSCQFEDRISKYTSGGVFSSYIGSDWHSPGGIFYIRGIVKSSTGNIYVSETYNHKVNIYNSAGIFQTSFGTAGVNNGEFNEPFALDIDSSDNIYVVDRNNSRVQKFDSSGNYISQFGTYGTGNMQFVNPWEIAVSSVDGSIYVLDYSQGEVKKFDSSFNYVTKVTGLSQPVSIDTDSSGNVYILNSANHKVKIYNSALVFQREFGSQGWSDGQFMGLQGISLDSSNNIYIGDTTKHQIQVFDNNGNYLYRFGGTYIEVDPYLNNPFDIFVDSSGYIYISDVYKAGVRIYGYPDHEPFLSSTITSSNIKYTSFDIAGTVTSEGSQNITERGIVYSTSNSTPTISDSKMTTTGEVGAFTVNLTGLENGTTYYVRGYATNSVGTGYSDPITVQTNPFELPEVFSTAIKDITINSAKLYGFVQTYNGAAITERGFVYSTSPNPTTSSTKAIVSGQLGTIYTNLTELSPDTTYYVRAYAINSVGTEYGTEFSFTTDANPQVVTVSGSKHTVTSQTDFEKGDYENNIDLTTTSGSILLSKGTTTNSSILDTTTAHFNLGTYTGTSTTQNDDGEIVITDTSGGTPSGEFSKTINADSTSDWLTLADIPESMIAATSAVIDGNIYIASGLDSDWDPILSTYIYSPDANEWYQMNGLPIDLTNGLGVNLDNKFYVVSGKEGSNTPTNKMYIFDPSTGEWTAGPQMTYTHNSPAGGVYNGKIYAVGGRSGTCASTSQVVEIYDPESETWSLGSAPSAKKLTGSTAKFINGKLYLAGGNMDCSNNFSKTLLIYDPELDSWSTGADMPFERAGGASAVVDGKFLYIGGSNSDYDSIEDIFAYDPETDSWEIYTDLPNLIHRPVVEYIDGKLYVIGGRDIDWYATNKTYSLDNVENGGQLEKFTSVDVDATIPANTSIELQYSYDNGVTFNTFGNVTTSTYNIPTPDDSASLVYKTLLGSLDTGVTPSLNSIQFNYTKEGRYDTEGTYYSPIYKGATGIDWKKLVKDSIEPVGTSILTYTRTGNSQAINDSWSDWQLLSGQNIISTDKRFLQFKLEISTTANSTPTISQLELQYSTPTQATDTDTNNTNNSGSTTTNTGNQITESNDNDSVDTETPDEDDNEIDGKDEEFLSFLITDYNGLELKNASVEIDGTKYTSDDKGFIYINKKLTSNLGNSDIKITIDGKTYKAEILGSQLKAIKEEDQKKEKSNNTLLIIIGTAFVLILGAGIVFFNKRT